MKITSTILDTWREYARRRSDRITHRATMLAVSELPPHLLKDIGWPADYERGRR